MIRKIRNFLAAAAIAAAPIATLLAPGVAHAATFPCTWTGATSNVFALAGNWSGCNSDFPQTADTDDLVFPVTATNKTITIPAGYTFSSITFNGTSTSGYALSGSLIVVSGDITDSSTNSGTDTTIANDVTFTGSPSTVTVSATSPGLLFSGSTSGTNAFAKAGAGTATFGGPFGITGAVSVNAGELDMAAQSVADATFSGVTVASGATFAYDAFTSSGITTYTFSKPITSAGGTLNFEGGPASPALTLNLTGTITLTADTTLSASSGTTVHITGPLHGPTFVLSATTAASVLNESSDNTTATPNGELIPGDDEEEDTPEAPDTGFALAAAHPLTTLAITVASAGTILAVARLTRKSASRR
jgi:autotransporter-associated beta strand protein